jgi:alpha-glucosidase
MLPALLFIAATMGAWAQTNWTLTSPNGRVSVFVKQEVVASLYAGQVNLYYRVIVDDSLALDWSPVGIRTSDQNFITDLTFMARTDSLINEAYSLPTGKRSHYVNHANQAALRFRNANLREVSFVFRAYNDAVAFRYELAGSGNATITGEQSGFNIPLGSIGWAQTYNPAYEATYDKGTVGTNFKTGDIGFPTLFQTPTNAWMLLSEAAVFGDYCASRLAALAGVPNVLMIKFPQTSISSTLPWKTPWRVALVGSSLRPVVESSVIEHLNPPSEVADVGWIKPGRSAWSWLSQNTGDLALQQTYTTFARQMGWEYNLIDDGFNKANMPALAQFSADSGVGMELWYRYTDLNTQAKQDAAFQQVKTWGVKSLKIDFIENDNQTTMKWYEMTAKNLAQYQLMATYHGSTIPRGERRRWPHIMTYEAVRGAEFYGRGYPGPVHNTTLPFTRNLIGPMDVTPVLFTTARLTNGTPTEKTTTDAHELAHAVLYETGIQHYADKPATYQAHPARPFLQMVPAAWDEVRFIDGYPGQRAVLARRKGNDWYIAGIIAGAATTITVPLDFLKPGTYAVDLYRDSTGVARPLVVQQVTINPATPVTIAVNTNGGFAFKVPLSNATAISPRAGRRGIRLFATSGKPFDILGRVAPESVIKTGVVPQPIVRRPE